MIYVFPTSQGFIFFTLLLALLLGSVNHNNNLGFILTFILSGMSLVSIFHTYRNFAGIAITAAGADPVFAGQAAVFEIRVCAEKFSRQSLTFHFPGAKGTMIDLLRDTSVAVKIRHETYRRGLLQPDVLCVSTMYPLGLFRAWSTLLLDTSCLVYPKPAPGPIVSGYAQENDILEGEPGGSGVDDFNGLAAYQKGDPLQRISWRSYSRGLGLYVKKFEGLQGKTFFFDPDVLPGTDLEGKLSRICHMILTAENMRLPYGLKMGSTIISPDLGGRHKRKCLRELALAKVNR